MAEEKGAAPEAIHEPEFDLEALFKEGIGETSAPETKTGEAETTARSEPPADKEIEEPGTGEPLERKAPEEEMVPKARLDEALRKAALAEKHGSLLDLVEADPSVARRIIAEKQYGVPEEKPVEKKPEERAAPTQAQIDEYWKRRFAEDTPGATAEMMDLKNQERELRDLKRTNSLAYSQYKSARREKEPLFAKYEHIMDEAYKRLDPRTFADDAFGVLEQLENATFGMWAREQRKRQLAAGGGKTLPREKPATTSVSTGGGNSPKSPAKPKRAPTEEELYISRTYRMPIEEVIAEADADKTGESPWGRSRP